MEEKQPDPAAPRPGRARTGRSGNEARRGWDEQQKHSDGSFEDDREKARKERQNEAE